MVAPINYLLFSYLQFTIYLLFPDIYYFKLGHGLAKIVHNLNGT